MDSNVFIAVCFLSPRTRRGIRPVRVGNQPARLRALAPAAFLFGSLFWLTSAAAAAAQPQITQVQITCSSGSMVGSGTDACTVTLSAPANHRGTPVNLSSSNPAVSVPSSVTVPSGSTGASFPASVSAVTSAQNVTLTARIKGSSANYSLQLEPAIASLTLSSTSVAFGNVALNTTATQSVTLTSSGTAPLTISAGSVGGSGFGMSGVNFPLTLNPGQAAALDLTFDPSTAGAATGTVSLTSNSSSGSAAVIQLSGTGGSSSYTVDLSWQAPSDGTDPVTGYNIYRAVGASSSYQQLNASADSSTTYADTSVQSGTTYSYYVESVDASGNASGPSNIYTVAIP